MSTDKILAPAVARASAVLDLLARADRPVALAELAKTLQLPKSSLHGLCATLETLNLITRLDGGQMALGPHVMMWANAFMSRLDITQEFFASWDDMRVLPEETITLSVRDGAEVVYIACRNGKHPLGLQFHPGMRLPAVYTATGLAMLSTLPDASVHKLLDTLPGGWPAPLTDHGLRDTASAIAELRRIRQRRYSTDREAVRDGMYCFGAPVFDSRHPEAVAGVAVSIRSLEANPALEARAGDAIRKLADRLSERLGATR